MRLQAIWAAQVARAVTLAALIAVPGVRAGAADLAEQPGVWVQDYTGRAADPNVRFGRLPNGVRYAILNNNRPEEAVSFRMRIGSGALQEHDDERGLAHFIEHMAFRGSTNVPDGEVVKILERQGLQFGADTNAGTNFDQTVYQFDFPHADASAISTGLMLFREIGGRLKIDPAAVDAERGVLLSEERARDNAAYRNFARQFAFDFPGQRLPTRMVIGTIDSLKTATAAQLRRYYEANYRPDNATIFVVGAVNVDEVEAKIKSMFADWRSTAATELINLGTVAPRGPMVLINSEAGAPDLIAIDWERAYDPAADTEARARRDYALALGDIILNRRLAEIAQMANAPFLGAGMNVSDVYKSAGQTQITLQPRKGQADLALSAVIAEQRRIVADGVRDDEIVSAKARLDAALKAAVASASTRDNRAIIDGMVNAVNTDNLITNPAQDYALYQKLAAGLTKTDIDAGLKRAFSGSGPLVLRSTPDATEETQAKLQSALQTALVAPLAKSTVVQVEPWPYEHFGPAGQVVARSEIKDLGVTLVTFKNGTRLAVKRTSFSADNIQVHVSFGQGRIGIPPALTHAAWLLGDGNAFLLGGTGKRTLTQINRENEGKRAGVSFATDDNYFTLSGSTIKADLNVQLQLLAAFVSDPGFRPEGVERIKASTAGQLPLLETIPSLILARDGIPLLYKRDPRWSAVPTPDTVSATTAADVPALLRDALQEPATVSIVGDVTVDSAISAVATTFGALPEGRAQSPIKPPEMIVDRAGSTPVVLNHKGRGDQGILAEIWPFHDYYSAPREFYVARVTAAIINARLVDTAREKLGLTYSPQTEVDASNVLPGFGYIGVFNETKPESMPQFQAVIQGVIADLAAKPVSADEFARAQKPLVDARTKATQTNGFWSRQLTELLHDPHVADIMRNYVKGIAAVRPDDVTRLAKTYLAGTSPLVIEVVPTASTQAK